MKRSVLALLLLSTFLFGLVGGPHPCHAAAERVSPAGGHASCHEMATAATAAPSSPQSALSVKAQDCCGLACRHSCHRVAVLSVEPGLLTVAPLSRKPAEKIDRNAPRVASGIDHIPLA